MTDRATALAMVAERSAGSLGPAAHSDLAQPISTRGYGSAAPAVSRPLPEGEPTAPLDDFAKGALRCSQGSVDAARVSCSCAPRPRLATR